MRRVVITGIGIISPIGENAAEVTESLKTGRSGITKATTYQEMGFRSQIHGQPVTDPKDHLDKRALRFMADGSAWATLAMQQAIEDAKLETSDISHPKTGVIVGTGGPSTRVVVSAADIARAKNPKRIGPFAVPKAMSSTASATLSTHFKILGINYSISSACATSLHCLGAGAEQIQWGKQDVMFVGGAEELDWSLSMLFDAMGALSSKYNDRPQQASRPFDVNRDGFIISGGSGIVVLEEYERAKARGAPIYAELVGYAATSDGADMVAPSGEGGERAMRIAMEQAGNRSLDYINPHATSTPVGDLAEAKSLGTLFPKETPPISATKCLTGHSLGAIGVQEVICSLLMMKHGFISPTINLEDRDPEVPEHLNLVTETRKANIDSFLSNSFGFGGTNGSVVVSRSDL